MKEQIKSILMREDFHPTLLGLFTNPFYFARKGLAEEVQGFGGNVQGRTLDVGCGNKHYRSFFSSSEYIGLEIDSEINRMNKSADYYYNGEVFPFSDSEFDSLVTNQVFEHVFNPDQFLDEAYRVLKQDGVMLMTVPFVWDEHEQPYDFARYSSFGIQHLLSAHGFEVLEIKKTMNDVRVIFQMVNAYIYKKVMTGNGYVNLLSTLILMAPVNILGELLNLLLPKNDDLYLDNVILVKKKALDK